MTDMLIDANSLYARSWFAAQRQSSNPAEALALALRTLCSLLNPDGDRIGAYFDRILCGWDGEQKIEKNRTPKPPEYHETRLIFRDVLSFAFGVEHAEHPKFEADDIVATAVYKDSTNQLYVVSGDKDLMQLAGGNCHYYCLNTKAVLSLQFILNKWGIKHPSQAAIALAIIGDPVDNIHGVPKWGAKKVQKLFEAVPENMRFDEVVAYIDSQIPPELKEAFWSSFDRTLLRTDVPGVPEPAPITFTDPKGMRNLGIPGFEGVYRELARAYGQNY